MVTQKPELTDIPMAPLGSVIAILATAKKAVHATADVNWAELSGAENSWKAMRRSIG